MTHCSAQWLAARSSSRFAIARQIRPMRESLA
jgi:hypothetical protein